LAIKKKPLTNTNQFFKTSCPTADEFDLILLVFDISQNAPVVDTLVGNLSTNIQ
tara:strand:+ start:1503 stop:1664 length:162 start_codon:yes stop_codon:yes gene_type:complete